MTRREFDALHEIKDRVRQHLALCDECDAAAEDLPDAMPCVIGVVLTHCFIHRMEQVRQGRRAEKEMQS